MSMSYYVLTVMQNSSKHSDRAKRWDKGLGIGGKDYDKTAKLEMREHSLWGLWWSLPAWMHLLTLTRLSTSRRCAISHRQSKRRGHVKTMCKTLLVIGGQGLASSASLLPILHYDTALLPPSHPASVPLYPVLWVLPTLLMGCVSFSRGKSCLVLESTPPRWPVRSWTVEENHPPNSLLHSKPCPHTHR